MLFPVFLVTAFFLTLNFNSRVLYSPGDFSDEGNFMSLYKEKTVKALAEIEDAIASDEKSINQALTKIQAKARQRGDPEAEIPKFIARNARGNVSLQVGQMVGSKAEYEELRKRFPKLMDEIQLKRDDQK